MNMPTSRTTGRDGGFDAASVLDLSDRVSTTLRAFTSLRTRRGLSCDEILIFLAIGHLGLAHGGAIPTMTPATYLEIAGFLRIPRETVRRKVGRLVDRALVTTSTRGVIVANVDEWHAIASIVQDQGSTANRSNDR